MSTELDEKLSQHGCTTAIECIEQLETQFEELKSKYVGAKHDYYEIQSDRDKLQTALFNARQEAAGKTFPAKSAASALDALKVPYAWPDSAPHQDIWYCLTNEGLRCWDNGVWLMPVEYDGWDPVDGDNVKWFIELDQLSVQASSAQGGITVPGTKRAWDKLIKSNDDQ